MPSTKHPKRPTRGPSAPAASTTDPLAAADPRPPRAARLEPEGATPTQVRAWGRARRNAVPREVNAGWQPAADRPDPVALLMAQSATRVPELVPIRHARMLASPFAFYRGAALIMAADLARTPASGIYVQSCGDAHLSNFGVFATPERRLAFDINDFDETHPAPFEWDLMRLAASLVIASHEIGLPSDIGRSIAERAARGYREHMSRLSDMTFLDVWYSRVDFEGIVRRAETRSSPAERRRAAADLRKIRARKTNAGALTRLAEEVDGRWQIRQQPPLIVRADMTPQVVEVLRDLFGRYARSLPRDLEPLLRHYHLADVARKVVGVGSVGTHAYVALLIGTRHRDPLFLQVKEADRSVLERYTAPSRSTNQGDRVVVGQRLMQASSDIFLGWSRLELDERGAVDVYVRQLNDWKASADVADMGQRRLTRYASLCAEALARAHARSGSALAIRGYLGAGASFDRAMAGFAVAYAEQNTKDYEAFRSAAEAGAIPVATEG